MRVYLRRETGFEMATDMEAESLYILAKLVEHGLAEVDIRIYYTVLPTNWCMMPIRQIDLDKTLQHYLCSIIEAEMRDTVPPSIG